MVINVVTELRNARLDADIARAKARRIRLTRRAVRNGIKLASVRRRVIVRTS